MGTPRETLYAGTNTEIPQIENQLKGVGYLRECFSLYSNKAGLRIFARLPDIKESLPQRKTYLTLDMNVKEIPRDLLNGLKANLADFIVSDEKGEVIILE